MQIWTCGVVKQLRKYNPGWPLSAPGALRSRCGAVWPSTAPRPRGWGCARASGAARRTRPVPRTCSARLGRHQQTPLAPAGLRRTMVTSAWHRYRFFRQCRNSEITATCILMLFSSFPPTLKQPQRSPWRPTRPSQFMYALSPFVRPNCVHLYCVWMLTFLWSSDTLAWRAFSTSKPFVISQCRNQFGASSLFEVTKTAAWFKL